MRSQEIVGERTPSRLTQCVAGDGSRSCLKNPVLSPPEAWRPEAAALGMSAGFYGCWFCGRFSL